MEKILVIVNGLPGKMATAVAEAVIDSPEMELLAYSLTGPEIESKVVMVKNMPINLCRPDEKNQLLQGGVPNIIVDFTHPSAINENVSFYTKNKIPFVLGTTGGNLEFITEKVKAAGSIAVAAPNMAKEIVAFQAMMEYAAENFPGVFKGCELEVVESYQQTKADTSGTAKAVINSFNKLGIPFTVDQIEKKRSRVDYDALGIPLEFWSGHGWHTYTVRKPDNSVFFQFIHNVNGRAAYIGGVMEAINFLCWLKSERPWWCGVHSMIDVLTLPKTKTGTV